VTKAELQLKAPGGGRKVPARNKDKYVIRTRV